MDLIKGDWENLEGRVIVYSKFVKKQSEVDSGDFDSIPDGKIFARQFSIGVSGEYLNLDPIKQKVDEFLKKHPLPEGVSAQLVPIAITEIEVFSENALKNGLDDVLYTGKYSTPMECELANYHGINYYHFRINSQKDNLGIELNPREPGYKSVSVGRFKDHVVGEYIAKLIDYSGYGDKNSFNDIKKKFFSFSKSSPFERDAVQLTKLIELGGANQDIKMIGHFLDVIVSKRMIEEYNIQLGKAVSDERYEDAAKYRDKINGLNEVILQK
jgi:hypothetical protein